MMMGNWTAFPFIGIFFMLAIAAFYVIVIVAMWRLMKAHESIAESLKHYKMPRGEKKQEP